MVRASVVVPARNAAATIGRCLAALAAQDLDAPYEVLVVDNGSDDGTAEIAERVPGPVRVLRQENLGPAAARNRGAAEASGAVLAFTDADCFPDQCWLRAGLAALEHVDLVQGRVAAEPNARRSPFDRTLWVVADDGLYKTANLLVRRETFDRVGGFEAWFSPEDDRPFGEDVVFAWRARRAGARAAFAPEALVHHAVLPGRPGDLLAERRRLGAFVDLVERVPELRRTLLFGGVFLSARTAAFDLAALACAAALLGRSPLPLAGVLPYAAVVTRERRPWSRWGAELATVEVIGDALGLAALVRRGLRRRTAVL